MKKKFKSKGFLWRVLLVIAALIVLIVVSCQSRKGEGKEGGLFYYGTTEKIPLVASNAKIIVKYNAEASKDREMVVKKLSNWGKAENLYGTVYSIMLRDSSQRSKTLETLKSDCTVVSVNPMYLTLDNQEMGVTDEIVLEFNKDADQVKILKDYNAKIIRRDKPWEKYFTIISVPRDKNALEVANNLKESGVVKYAHPDFIAKTYMHAHIPNDTYFAWQFYLNNTGQTINDGHTCTPDADIDAPEAWDITRGSNTITIAVIDEGVERHNTDLPAARLVILNGSNFASGSANDPEGVGDGAHGTCCAGIIAAEQDNNQGVTGVAPLCRIMPVRIPFGYVPNSTYANAINFAWSNGADVLSNSWGYGSTADIPVITAAISNAITLGRSGTGSVVVWSAGNTADHAGGNIGFVSYPGCVAVANVITVGASDRNDHQANYSPTGAGVDVVAPSHLAYSNQIAGETWEVWSTDIVGNAGYNTHKSTDGGTIPVIGETLPSTGVNNLDYTGRMGGTSAACPEVAGIAALILTLHPTYTPAQVFNTIINTTDKVGGYTYTGGRCDEMGYGRVNAFNAVSGRLWMKDTPDDPGTEPNLTGEAMYISEDIWNRKTADGGLTNEPAEYRISGPPNAIYVKVRNSGNEPASATLKVYWAKASSGLGWPDPWNGGITSPALMGNPVGTKSIGPVPAGGEMIFEFDWMPPDPNLYTMFGPDQNHFCLLARIETSSTAPYGMTFPETGNLWDNVMNNNHIIWKNIQVYDLVVGDAAAGGMLVANFSKAEERTRLTFVLPKDQEKTPLLRYGELTVLLPEKLYKFWKEAGAKGEGFKADGNLIYITSPKAWIGEIRLRPKEIYGIQVKYKLKSRPDIKDSTFAFAFEVQQTALIKDRWVKKGGVQFKFYPFRKKGK